MRRFADQLETTASANRNTMTYEGLATLNKGTQLQRDLADIINFHANTLHDLTGSRRLLSVAKTAVAVFVAGVGLLADAHTLTPEVEEAEAVVSEIERCLQSLREPPQKPTTESAWDDDLDMKPVEARQAYHIDERHRLAEENRRLTDLLDQSGWEAS